MEFSDLIYIYFYKVECSRKRAYYPCKSEIQVLALSLTLDKLNYPESQFPYPKVERNSTSQGYCED